MTGPQDSSRAQCFRPSSGPAGLPLSGSGGILDRAAEPSPVLTCHGTVSPKGLPETPLMGQLERLSFVTVWKQSPGKKGGSQSRMPAVMRP